MLARATRSATSDVDPAGLGRVRGLGLRPEIRLPLAALDVLRSRARAPHRPEREPELESRFGPPGRAWSHVGGPGRPQCVGDPHRCLGERAVRADGSRTICATPRRPKALAARYGRLQPSHEDLGFPGDKWSNLHHQREFPPQMELIQSGLYDYRMSGRPRLSTQSLGDQCAPIDRDEMGSYKGELQRRPRLPLTRERGWDRHGSLTRRCDR